MALLRRFAVLILLALGLVSVTPPSLMAQGFDGIDNDEDGEIDEAGEIAGGGNDMGRMEAICNATAQIEACLFAHNMFCQQFGLAQSCALASIGNNCNGGDPGQCQYYQALMQADMACRFGDQAACGWLGQQPVIADFQ